MATKKRTQGQAKTKVVNPWEVKGDTAQVVKTILSLTAKDFPEPEQVLEWIRTLKVDADLSEMRLIAYLRAYELSGLWKATSPRAHFEGWLRQFSTALPDVVRYKNGVAALTQYGPEVCVRHGFKPIVVVSTKLSNADGHKFIRQVLDPKLLTRRFPLSATGTNDLVKDFKRDNHIEDKSPPRVPKSDLRLQLDDSLAEVARLKVENKALRKERDQLTKKLAQYEKPSRKAA